MASGVRVFIHKKYAFRDDEHAVCAAQCIFSSLSPNSLICISNVFFQSICSRFSDFPFYHDVRQSQLLLENSFVSNSEDCTVFSFILVTFFSFAHCLVNNITAPKNCLQNYFNNFLWGVHYIHICTQINNGNSDPIKVFMTFYMR